MDSLSFWALVVWSVANIALWCHAMYLYRKTRRDCARVLDLLDRPERLRGRS